MTDHEFDVEDVEYLRHGDKPLLARTYIPRGAGPFPCVVELHGGAWSQFERTRGKSVHEALARSGVTVVAPDFRQGAEGAYPLSVADVNFCVRWVKHHAAALKTTPDRIGMSGNSTGGHLAMLVAMRPDDPRYNAIALPGAAPGLDARVRCVAMLWPVVNPLGRYHHARRLLGRQTPPEWAPRIVRFHELYWGGEAAMAEGNPMLALERGESLVLPPALWLQSTQDEVHVYKDPTSSFPGGEIERFAHSYRAAGGSIELEYFDAPMMFTTAHPTLPESIAALRTVVNFVHRNMKD
jgi:acetyl esterase/lipase